MPREDETYRTARYGGHPPYCTCVDCVRLRRQGRRRGRGSGINWRAVINTVVVVVVVAILVYFLVSGS